MEEINEIIEETQSIFDEFELESANLRINLSIVESTIDNINKYGVSKTEVLQLADAGYCVTTRDIPIESFTARPSTVNLVHVGESITGSIGKGITAVFTFIYNAIVAMFKAIGRFLRWFWRLGNVKITKDRTVALELLQYESSGTVLRLLDEKNQIAMINDLAEVNEAVVRLNTFTDKKDESLFDNVVRHVDVIRQNSPELVPAMKDLTGAKAALIEGYIATSAKTLLTGIHTNASINIPELADKGPLLGEYTKVIGELQADVTAGIKKSKESKATKDITIVAIKKLIGETFKGITDLEKFRNANDFEKLADGIDKMVADVEKFSKDASKILSKETVGVFFKSKTAENLKQTQVTIQRSNQIVLIAMQRLAYYLSLRDALSKSKFATNSEKYAKVILANRKIAKSFTVVDVATVLKDKQKKKD